MKEEEIKLGDLRRREEVVGREERFGEQDA